METAATPMLKQYHDIKSRHQDCILFFRLGDFYEMFFQDAVDASSILDLVLTSRGHDAAGKVPMCGIPYHAADNYIAKLIKAGKKVAICEQVEDPAAAKGIVKRDVVRIISAGTYLDDATDSRYLLSLSPQKDGRIGFAFCDTAGSILSCNQMTTLQEAVELLTKLPVFECLYPENSDAFIKELMGHPLLKLKNICISPLADWHFNAAMAYKNLCAHFGVMNLNGYGIDDNQPAQSACGALLEYLKAMNKQPLKHINAISLYTHHDYAFISPAAHYGLELPGVCSLLDLTQTPFGRRLFRFWLYHPLKQRRAIQERQEAVALLRDHPAVTEQLDNLFKNFPDLEKAVSRLSCGCGSIKDFLALRQGLLRAPMIAETLNQIKNPLLNVNDIPSLRELLTAQINPDAPLAKPEGKIIQAGVNAALDALRDIQENGRQWLSNFQAREIKRTGINSLKVGFNNVFGYYIEISKANQKSAPADYVRKQTLVNGERYITAELKEYEEKILTAQEKINTIERQMLRALEAKVLDAAPAISLYTQAVARADCLLSLSKLFAWDNYVLPDITDDTRLDIKDGRHPIVEKSIPDHFTANDTLLDTTENHLVILTGPNMAGKSTYIRQTALLVIMAQMGAPIPAASATIGIADKIFTRIGAHDEIAKGQSTFMVEMTETAHILNNLTPKSLVILDEIGRGTSTSDGLCLAWALAEHMAAQKVRTLFATHFHELIVLAAKHPGIKNYNVAVKEWKDKIIFLHKIIPGGSDDSYGIYVAKLAGIPAPVIARAKAILNELEIGAPALPDNNGTQLNLFPSSTPALDGVKGLLADLDINAITPLDALKMLNELKNKILP